MGITMSSSSFNNGVGAIEEASAEAIGKRIRERERERERSEEGIVRDEELVCGEYK